MDANRLKELQGFLATETHLGRKVTPMSVAEVAALLDEVEALTADAERYRYLRSLEFAPKKGPFIAYQTPWGCSMRNGSHADRATDAARHEPKDAER
jgi:hypothetical protein